METIYNYIIDPRTLVTFILFVFWLGTTWANLNNRIKLMEKKAEELEKRVIEIDMSKDEIKLKLVEISRDLKRIMDELKGNKK